MSDNGILFSEWAAGTPSARLLGGVDTRPPCPICQNPHGDCTHESTEGA